MNLLANATPRFSALCASILQHQLCASLFTKRSLLPLLGCRCSAFVAFVFFCIYLLLFGLFSHLSWLYRPAPFASGPSLFICFVAPVVH